MQTINYVLVPAKAGTWHRFIITRKRGVWCRVAYQLEKEGRQLTNQIVNFETVDSVASWYLDPEALTAYERQRKAGWDGANALQVCV
jgi:hypothetical protein